jgi:hypothetical protein
MVEEARSWRDLLAGLERLGDRVRASAPAGDRDHQTEGFAHLAEQLLCWLEWSMGYGDAARPAFQRQNDLVTPWGGPNADNIYRHARISPRCTYVVRGRMNSCDDFALAVREGFRHTDTPATLVELTASDIGIGPGDAFTLLLGGSGPEPNRIPLPEGSVMCSVREYYFEWLEREPATWTIEHLSGDPASEPSFSGHMEEALRLTEQSIVYWADYMRAARARQEDNAFGSKVDVPRGLRISQFLFCFFDLGPDEALVVETRIPDARYWSFQLYGLEYFRPLDIGLTTSLNNRQISNGDGERMHVVVSPEDPGVPNWLDTMGRRAGLLNYRHFWGAPMPSPHTRVVPIEDVRDVLPPDTPVVASAQREAEILARRRHLSWRFRT